MAGVAGTIQNSLTKVRYSTFIKSLTLTRILRMSRSLKKGPYTDAKLQIKATKAKAAGPGAPVKTWSRASTIIPDFVGLKFGVHNGRKFIDVLVTEEMVGHRLGEFSPTTMFKAHGGKAAKVARK